MTHQNFFDLDRSDVDTPAFDHLFEPAPVIQAPLLIHQSQISGAEESILIIGFSGLFWLFVIRQKERSSHPYFTNHPGTQRLTGLNVADARK